MLARLHRAAEQEIVPQKVAQQQARFDAAPVWRAGHGDGDLVLVSVHDAPVHSPWPTRVRSDTGDMALILLAGMDAAARIDGALHQRGGFGDFALADLFADQ